MHNKKGGGPNPFGVSEQSSSPFRLLDRVSDWIARMLTRPMQLVLGIAGVSWGVANAALQGWSILLRCVAIIALIALAELAWRWSIQALPVASFNEGPPMAGAGAGLVVTAMIGVWKRFQHGLDDFRKRLSHAKSNVKWLTRLTLACVVGVIGTAISLVGSLICLPTLAALVGGVMVVKAVPSAELAVRDAVNNILPGAGSKDSKAPHPGATVEGKSSFSDAFDHTWGSS